MSSSEFLRDAQSILGDTSPFSDSCIYSNTSHQEDASEPYFSHRSHRELDSILDTVNLIKSRLTPEKGKEEGVVYILQAREIDLVKVGYTTMKDLSRVEKIMKDCGVHIERMYETRPFVAAFRAEQILHKLLREWGYYRLSCTCGSRNQEWFRKPFTQIVGVVDMVFRWFETQKPYNIQDRELRQIWVDAVDKWHISQLSQNPLEWIDLFLMNENYIDGRQLFASSVVKITPNQSQTPDLQKQLGNIQGGLHRLHISAEELEMWKSFSAKKRQKKRTPIETPTRNALPTIGRSPVLSSECMDPPDGTASHRTTSIDDPFSDDNEIKTLDSIISFGPSTTVDETPTMTEYPPSTMNVQPLTQEDRTLPGAYPVSPPHAIPIRRSERLASMHTRRPEAPETIIEESEQASSSTVAICERQDQLQQRWASLANRPSGTRRSII